ncbi:unnamed protein product [Brachionus calyciflorus]|uniref:Cadherin domain-containing protein n=1 Tax=Brachionus calyciflorus TaxID=104777 RepID=A0A813V6L4_9BILA|nr:unnamed protein product [Brachionus calyciflorus]
MLFITIIIIYLVPTSSTLGTYLNLIDKKIPEEIPIGSLITDLNEELNLLNTTRDYDAENLHFTFLDDIKTSTENVYFLLDPITGRLTSKRYLDRESMCLNKHCSNTCQPDGDCVINVKVLVIPSYNIINFNVEIQDINDNRPFFASDYQIEKIPENVLIGHKIPLEVAYDPDSGVNSVQNYKILEKETPFEIELNDGLFLVVTEKLDREIKPGYNLTIEACDGGKPINCGRSKINIILTDVNDNSPQFEQLIYKFKIYENELSSAVIGQAKAVDLDEGLNSKIKYSLMNNPGDYFTLNEDNGELSLKKWFDYEKENFFTINIEARDMGLGSLQAYTTVEINVLDMNDNEPEISVSFLNVFHRNLSSLNHILIYIPENLEENKFIAHVQIEDKDHVKNLEWNIYVNDTELKIPSVLNSEEKNFFRINKLNSESFTLNTGSRILDRETTPQLKISIRTSDLKNIVYFNFTIILLDENDNSPKMDKEIYELNINENNYLDQLIHKFDAHDPDLDQNGMIVYELESMDKISKIDFVYIEPLTGYLRASKIFDREIKSFYEFNLIARDNPKNFTLSKMTRVKCRLNIIDLNDNKPFITFDGRIQKNLTLKIDENLHLNSEILRINCQDKDLNSNIIYMIKNQPETSASGELVNDLPFKLSQNGVLTNYKNLDREFQDAYELELVCSDTKFNSSLNLKIFLNDLNDNCPRNLYKPNEDIIKFINFYNMSTNEVFKEFYTDDDVGKNSILKFDLLNFRDIFFLSVNEMLETKPQIYELNIKIKNSSLGSVKLGRYDIRVRVKDVDCEKIEKFILYIGDENVKNESLFLDTVNKIDIMSKMSLKASNLIFILILIGFFASILMFLIIILVTCIFKKNKIKKKQKEIDCIKVRNYRLMEATENRLSLNTDQSAESVLSNASSPSSNSTQQLNVTYYQLSSFQKQKVVNISDYSASIGSTDLSDSAGDVNEIQNGIQKVRYKYDIVESLEEKQPCLVDVYHNENNYGHYLRSSIV